MSRDVGLDLDLDLSLPEIVSTPDRHMPADDASDYCRTATLLLTDERALLAGLDEEVPHA